MQTEEMIPADEFCIHHKIGLLEIFSTEEKIFVPVNQLNRLESLVRLYYEMDINLEGIETISYLLQRMSDMQQQISLLSNRLSRYEQD